MKLPVLERKVNGVILYEGPSLFNGKPIVVIATGFADKTANKKTGNMIQTWILCSGKKPTDASRLGHDESVCGNCKHRHFRSCYVNLCHGPNHVWDAYKAGSYTKLPLNHSTAELFRDRTIRLGSYGDPAAVPVNVWHIITRVCKGWTGYTHSFMKADIAIRDYCMASCDTLEEVSKAIKKGWKPFYARQSDDKLPKGYFVCPASKEAGNRLDCERCRVCNGGEYRGQAIPSIIVHGPRWKGSYFRRGIRLIRAKKKFIGMFPVKS